MDDGILFTTRREYDLLLNGYPKSQTLAVPNASYGTFYDVLLENVPNIPSGYQMQVVAQFRSVSDGDTSWKQLNSYGYLVGTGPADLSGANMLSTDVYTSGSDVRFSGSNWGTGPGGSARTVTLTVRWWVYLTRL